MASLEDRQRTAQLEARRQRALEDVQANQGAPFGETLGEFGAGVREGVLEAGSVGFWDELAGFFVSRLTGEPYQQARNRVRRTQAEAMEQAPAAYLLGAGGTAAATGAAAPVVGAATLGPRAASAARPVALTTGYGALAGAGMAEELGDVPGQALFGAGVGLALPPVLEGGARLLANPAAAARPVAGAVRRATTVPVEDQIVDQELARILQRSGRTPAEIMADLDRYGPDTVLADVLGDAGPTELRRAMTDAGTRESIMQRLGDRQWLARNVVRQEAREGLGVTGDVRATQRKMREDRAEAASELYDDAYAVPVEMTDELRELLTRPAVQQAYRDAQRSAANAGRPFPQIFTEDADGVLTLNTEVIPDFQSLDFIKRRLDAAVRKVGRNVELGRGSEEYGDIRDLRNEFREYLKKVNEPYREALNQYQSGSALIEASEMGRDALKKDVYVEDLEEMMKDMTEGEVEAFRLGVAGAIENNMRNLTESRDAAAFLTNENIQEKMSFLMKDDDAAMRFMNRMRGVQAQRRTKTIAEGGPKTAADIEAAGQRDLRIAEIAKRAGQEGGRSSRGLARMAFDVVTMFFRRNPEARLTPQIQEKLAEALMSNNRTQLRKALEQAAPANIKAPRNRSRWATARINALRAAAANPSVVQQAIRLGTE